MDNRNGLMVKDLDSSVTRFGTLGGWLVKTRGMSTTGNILCVGKTTGYMDLAGAMQTTG